MSKNNAYADDETAPPEVRERPLSENTNVRMSLVIAILGLCAAGFGLWIWWASAINTKLDTVISLQSAQSAEFKAIRAEVDDLKAWRKLVDAYGSPNLANRVESIDKRIDALAKEFDLHQVRDGRK